MLVEPEIQDADEKREGQCLKACIQRFPVQQKRHACRAGEICEQENQIVDRDALGKAHIFRAIFQLVREFPEEAVLPELSRLVSAEHREVENQEKEIDNRREEQLLREVPVAGG